MACAHGGGRARRDRFCRGAACEWIAGRGLSRSCFGEWRGWCWVDGVGGLRWEGVHGFCKGETLSRRLEGFGGIQAYGGLLLLFLFVGETAYEVTQEVRKIVEAIAEFKRLNVQHSRKVKRPAGSETTVMSPLIL